MGLLTSVLCVWALAGMFAFVLTIWSYGGLNTMAVTKIGKARLRNLGPDDNSLRYQQEQLRIEKNTERQLERGASPSLLVFYLVSTSLFYAIMGPLGFLGLISKKAHPPA